MTNSLIFILPVNTCIRAIVLNLCVINKGNYLHVPTFFGLALFALVWKSYKFICRDEDGWIDIVAIFTQY